MPDTSNYTNPHFWGGIVAQNISIILRGRILRKPGYTW